MKNSNHFLSVIVPVYKQEKTIEKDLQNILTKKYSLSIGRLYQILKMIRENEKFPIFIMELVNFWKSEIPDTFHILISDEFFLSFSLLMDREIFSKKRHEKKVTFSDVKRVREVLIEDKNLLLLFS